jgi:hypothetical protein
LLRRVVLTDKDLIPAVTLGLVEGNVGQFDYFPDPFGGGVGKFGDADTYGLLQCPDWRLNLAGLY